MNSLPQSIPLRVVLRADLLSDRHFEHLSSLGGKRATIRRVLENSTDPDSRQAMLDADVLIGWASADLLLESKVLTYLCGSAGVDAYQCTGLAAKPGFVLCNASGTMVRTMAEHALGFMLHAARAFDAHVTQQRQGLWQRIPNGGEITDKTVCILGYGEVGADLAGLLRPFSAKIIALRRSNQPIPDVARCYSPDEITEAVATADHVVCCLPGGDATRGMINETVFAAMKPGSCFHAVSRGSVIDFPALEQALVSGQLRFAGLDVAATEPLDAASPLWKMPNVLLTSHSAGWSDRLADRLTELFARNLANHLDQRPLQNVIELH